MLTTFATITLSIWPGARRGPYAQARPAQSGAEELFALLRLAAQHLVEAGRDSLQRSEREIVIENKPTEVTWLVLNKLLFQSVKSFDSPISGCAKYSGAYGCLVVLLLPPRDGGFRIEAHHCGGSRGQVLGLVTLHDLLRAEVSMSKDGMA